MSELIERVAFAICSCQPCICKNRAGFTGMPCLDRARKGIEAMREPTRKMCWDGLGDSSNGLVDAGMRLGVTEAIWQRMIDAALREDKP